MNFWKKTSDRASFPANNAGGEGQFSQQGQLEFESILNGLSDPLILYDQNFRILFFNPAAEDLFKIKASSILGKSLQPQEAERSELRVLVQVLFPSLAPVMVPRSPSGVWPQVVDISFTEPNLDLRVTTSRIEMDPGQPARFLKIIRDRTREIGLVKTKSDFVTVASHQLKTPITNIQWALETLSEDTTLSDPNQEIVRNAVEAARLLAKIVEDLLSSARIEEGRFGYHFERADLTAFLNQILNQALPQARRAGMRIYFKQPPGPLPMVAIDPQKLSLAVTNILENAIRYNVKNGEVIIGIEQPHDKPFLQVSAKDTGIGIPAEEIPKLFSKFFRAENAVKFQTEGTGLGLYIAKNIIQAHGGRIWAESEVNRGSTFYFTLPTDPQLVPQVEIPMGD